LNGRRVALVLGPLLAILLHLPTLGHDLVFDDQVIVGGNPLLRDLRSVPRLLVTPYWSLPGQPHSLYRPLTTVSFAIDRALAGGIRLGWLHLVNVLLHALVTLLLIRLALEILPVSWAAGLAGLLFAAHPVHVEAVAGLVGRAELLAAGGVLLAILCHLAALRCEDLSRRRRLSIFAWLAAGAGMLAKESAAIAPLLCAAADLAFVRAGERGRPRLYAGHAVALGITLAIRTAVLGGLGVGAAIPFVDNPAASAGPLDGRLTAIATLPRYALLLLWPARLSADYSFDQIPVVHQMASPAVLGGVLLLLLTVGGGIFLLRRAPAAGFSLLFMPLSAALTTNLIVFIGTLMAERLMYLPSAGLCLLAGCLASAASRPASRRTAMAAGLALCAAGAWRTWTRLPDWQDDYALYRSASLVSPRSARIRFNLGNAYLRRNEYPGAVENYRRALSIYPSFEDARVNLGMALLQENQPREALDLLRAAAEQMPGSADLAVNLGTAFRALGEPARAEEEFRRALRIDPCAARAWNDLGSIDLARGENEAAIASLREAVRCEPDFAIFHVNLADALTSAGRRGEAAAEFEAAFRLDPAQPEARRGRGEMALWSGDLSRAEREFAAAESGRPPSARAANFLGYLAAGRGDPAGAAGHYERALQIDSSLADAHRSLGLLYIERLGRPTVGASHLERSLALDPGQADAGTMRRLILSAKKRGS